MWGTSTVYSRSGLSFKPLIAVILLWELVSRGGVINPTFYPPPTLILDTAIDLFRNQGMAHHLRVSLQRVLLSLLLGGTTGVFVGLAMGWSRPIRTLINPYIGLLYPIPKVVVLPIMFAFFGISETARVLTMSLAVFLLVAMSTLGGVRNIDDVYFEVALDNGADRAALFREVIIPATLPQIFTGLSLGFGVGFIIIVVVEIAAADAGLGYVIWKSWRLFTIPRMYVALLLINVIGVVFLYGIEELGYYLTPWHQ